MYDTTGRNCEEIQKAKEWKIVAKDFGLKHYMFREPPGEESSKHLTAATKQNGKLMKRLGELTMHSASNNNEFCFIFTF